MTAENKRMLTSVSAALLIHAAAFVLIGMNTLDFTPPREYGPLEVSLEQLPVKDKPAEPEQKNLEETAPQQSPSEAEQVNQAEALPPEKTVAPEPQPVPVQRTSPAKSTTESRTYTASSADEDIISSIQSRTNSSGNVDLSRIWGSGSDSVPATTPESNTAAAGGAGSYVEYSDVPVESQTTLQSAENVPSETSILGSDVLANLDERLSSQNTNSSSNSESVSNSTGAVGSAPAMTNNGPALIIFDDPSIQRKVIEPRAQPEIPEDIKTAGTPKYTLRITFLVNAEGYTSSFQILQPSGNSILDSAVQAALRKWQFEPARGQSSEEKVRATLTYVIETK